MCSKAVLNVGSAQILRGRELDGDECVSMRFCAPEAAPTLSAGVIVACKRDKIPKCTLMQIDSFIGECSTGHLEGWSARARADPSQRRWRWRHSVRGHPRSCAVQCGCVAQHHTVCVCVERLSTLRGQTTFELIPCIIRVVVPPR